MMRKLSLLFLFSLSGCVIEINSPVLCADPDACGDEQYCEFPQGGACGAYETRGLCLQRPDACPEYYSPVCGCDGLTYGNPCDAHAGGTDVARQGACEDPCVAQDARGVGQCDLFLGWYWDGNECAPLSGCRCEGVDCRAGYATDTACASAHESCAGPTDCDASSACAAAEWCDYPEGSRCGGGGSTGVCRDRPTACPPVIHPVCGCDGTTYSSGCDANVAGTDVAYDGECDGGAICGGFAGFVCAAAEYCDYPPGAICGATDQTGVCRVRPDACIAIYDPVCGCDNVTYGNECSANAAGIDIAYFGPCSDGTRCGGLGPTACSASEWCDVADGASCDAPGLCRPRPEACPEYYSPVCGCDGVTYANPCFAEGAGTDVAYPGPCADPADCRSTGCETGHYCGACEQAGGGVAWVCLPDGAAC